MFVACVRGLTKFAVGHGDEFACHPLHRLAVSSVVLFEGACPCCAYVLLLVPTNSKEIARYRVWAALLHLPQLLLIEITLLSGATAYSCGWSSS